MIVARGSECEIRAFHNACTHRGTRLVREESGKRTSLTCRYHAWTLGTDGRLLSATDFERFYIEDKATCDLRRVSVDVHAGLLFVNLDPAPKQSLAEFLGLLVEMIADLPVSRATTLPAGFAAL